MTDKSKQIRPPVEILKENYAKLRFKHFYFDNNLLLCPKSKMILSDFYKAFYSYNEFKGKKTGFLKKKRFEKKYRNDPGAFPGLIKPETTSSEQLCQAAPGFPVEHRLIIGYFKLLKDVNDKYFINPFTRTIEPVNAYIIPVSKELKKIIDGLGAEHPHKDTLSAYYYDTSIISQICNFIAKLYRYTENNNLPPLKSGHLISFVGGAYNFFIALKERLTEFGFAAVSVGNMPPINSEIDTLIEQLESCLSDLTIDLIYPLAESINAELLWENEHLTMKIKKEIQKGGISVFFDFIANLFKRKKKKKQKKYIDTPKKESVKPIQKKAPAKIHTVKAAQYIEIYGALKKFVNEMRKDLAPELNEKNEVLDYKSMFDQFDVKPELRDMTYTRFVLQGRMTGVDLSDYRYQDQTIISSTHWIFDRINNILRVYSFDIEKGVELKDAENFLSDIRYLYYVSKNESDETRLYGNFPQFRINLRRLFSSIGLQSKYNGLIAFISEQMDKAREQLHKKKDDIAKNHH